MDNEHLLHAETTAHVAYRDAQDKVERFEPPITDRNRMNLTLEVLEEYDQLIEQRDTAKAFWERTRDARLEAAYQPW